MGRTPKETPKRLKNSKLPKEAGLTQEETQEETQKNFRGISTGMTNNNENNEK